MHYCLSGLLFLFSLSFNTTNKTHPSSIEHFDVTAFCYILCSKASVSCSALHYMWYTIAYLHANIPLSTIYTIHTCTHPCSLALCICYFPKGGNVRKERFSLAYSLKGCNSSWWGRHVGRSKRPPGHVASAVKKWRPTVSPAQLVLCSLCNPGS